MGKPAVLAPDREMPAADDDIMGTGHMAVPALRIAFKFPCIIAPNFCKGAWLAYVLNAGDEDPGCTAVIARDLSFVRNGFDDLVCDLFAVVAISTVGQEDELVTHVR